MSTRPLKRNFVVNLLYPTVRIAVAFVTIPIYLRHVGEARYGIISIVWVLLGLFGFLDLGLSRAVTNALAKLRDAPQTQRARVLLTTLGLNLGIGLIGGVVLYISGGLLLRHFISVPTALSAEVSGSLPWIACLLPLTLVSAAGAGALESRELFLLVNLIQIVAMRLAQVAPVVVAVFVSPSLRSLFPPPSRRRRLARSPCWFSSSVWRGRSRFAPWIGARRANCLAMAGGCSPRM